MNTNIKRIAWTVLMGYAIGTVMPSVCADDKYTTKKAWPTWIKVGAAASCVAGLCAWYYMDVRLQNLLATSINGAQTQFVEDLKHHAVLNADRTPRLISATTSYKVAPDAELLKNTTASLKLLGTDFKAELVLYQIGSKLCALAAALGLYGFVQSVRESTDACDVESA
jgi:hypothetical protein